MQVFCTNYRGKFSKTIVTLDYFQLSIKHCIYSCIVLVQVGSALVENLNDDLDYDPQVAIKCGKVTRHIDVNTGSWEADKNSTSLCAVTMKEILK